MDLLKSAYKEAAAAVDKYVPPAAKTELKKYVDKAKAYMNNASELEMKVLDATNHEPWGPHGQAMNEISNAAFDAEGFQQIMGVVEARLHETPENWRLIYKTLLLLEHMCKRGPLRVVDYLQTRKIPTLERLRDRFDFKEPSGKDQGINVRNRAGELLALITDSRRLDEERDKAAKNANKYTGVSSTGSTSGRYGGFAGGASATGSSSYGSNSYGSGSGAYGGSGGDYGSASKAYGSGSAYGNGGAAPYKPPSRPTSAGGEAAAPAEDADAVEATRRRIAALKAQGALPDGSPTAGGRGSGGGTAPAATGDPPRLFDDEVAKPKKKLTDVKLNPAIAATFAKVNFTPAAPRTTAPPAAMAGAAAAPAADAIDLLGDLEVPAPAAPAAPAAAAAVAGGWDAFSSAAVPAAAAAPAAHAGDDWSSFSAAAPAKAPLSSIESLLGGGSPPKGAGGALPVHAFSAPTATPAATPADPFAMPVAAPAPVASTAAPFAAMPAVSGFGAPAAADPFATAAFAGAATAASSAAAKLGPETEKAAQRAKDPFADLGF